MVRKLFVLAALVPAAVLVVPAAPAQARACQVGYHCTTTYYADSSRTTVVGRLTEYCDGSRHFWGTHGESPRFVESPC